MTERQTLRQQLRLARHAFDPHEHAWRSAAITRQLVNHRLFRAAQHIACYLSNDAEVDMTSLMDCAWHTPAQNMDHHTQYTHDAVW